MGSEYLCESAWGGHENLSKDLNPDKVFFDEFTTSKQQSIELKGFYRVLNSVIFLQTVCYMASSLT